MMMRKSRVWREAVAMRRRSYNGVIALKAASRAPKRGRHRRDIEATAMFYKHYAVICDNATGRQAAKALIVKSNVAANGVNRQNHRNCRGEIQCPECQSRWRLTRARAIAAARRDHDITGRQRQPLLRYATSPAVILPAMALRNGGRH